MKNRVLPLMMALMLSVGAFAFPVSAYASSGEDTTPPKISVDLEKDTLHISASDNLSGVEAVYVDKTRVNSLADGKGSVLLKDYAGKEKQVSVYAVDYSGNQSETVKLDNPYYEEPQKAEPETDKQAASGTAPAPSPAPSDSGTEENTQESGGEKPQAGSSSGQSENSAQEEETETALPEGALTPDGTGTILDSATEQEDDKQFYTITTDAGNVFYLVIDGKRGSENVYFLNGVTESDLMALAEKEQGTSGAIPETETCTCTEKCEAGAVNTACPVCKNELSGCLGKADEKPAQDEAPQPEKEEKQSNTGMIFFVLIAFAVAGGLGYYFKIVRPKQQAAMDDTDEYEDDGYGEGFEPDSEYQETLPEDTDEDETTEDGR